MAHLRGGSFQANLGSPIYFFPGIKPFPQRGLWVNHFPLQGTTTGFPPRAISANNLQNVYFILAPIISLGGHKGLHWGRANTSNFPGGPRGRPKGAGFWPSLIFRLFPRFLARGFFHFFPWGKGQPRLPKHSGFSQQFFIWPWAFLARPSHFYFLNGVFIFPPFTGGGPGRPPFFQGHSFHSGKHQVFTGKLNPKGTYFYLQHVFKPNFLYRGGLGPDFHFFPPFLGTPPF